MILFFSGNDCPKILQGRLISQVLCASPALSLYRGLLMWPEKKFSPSKNRGHAATALQEILCATRPNGYACQTTVRSLETEFPDQGLLGRQSGPVARNPRLCS